MRASHKKRIVFLSVNREYLSAMADCFTERYDGETHIVLREGISPHLVRSLQSSESFKLIPYGGDTYEPSTLKNIIHDRYTEAVLLCRNTSVNRAYFERMIDFSRSVAKKVYLLDVEKRKRRICGWRDTALSIVRFLDALLYRAFRTILFSSTCLTVVAFLLFKWMRYGVKRWLRLKPYICIAKRVHSNQSPIIAKGLRDLGYPCCSVDIVGHPYGYDDCDIQYALKDRNHYIRFMILSLIYAKCVLFADLILFQNNGESFFASPAFKNWRIPLAYQFIELISYKLMRIKLIFEMRDCSVYDPEKGRTSSRRNVCKSCNDFRVSHLCGNEYYTGLNRTAMRFADKVLFSTFDLEEYLPAGAEWLPNAYVLKPFEQNKKHNQIVKIIHSSTCEDMKGTRLLYPIIEELRHQYAIEFEILQGLPHKSALEKIKKADIAIGQFNCGGYGNFEIECMMHGKPVIGYINPEFVSRYPHDLPIVRVNEENISDSIMGSIVSLIRSKHTRDVIGRQSRKYALRVHGDMYVVKRLRAIIEQVLS